MPGRPSGWRPSCGATIPTTIDGPRLVVDIASPRRRYGRLVEFPPPDAEPSAWETQVLDLYADYAATALDVFSVLSDAKRSDATARTLLSFSESLSRVTTLAELVQLLADTVPAVTDCDQATVYLWETDTGQLVPRARTAGLESPDAYTGPIVPVAARPGATPAAGSIGRRRKPSEDPPQPGTGGR